MQTRILLTIVVALLGACAPAEDAPPDAAPGAEVTVAGFAFEPETLSSAPGATVAWTNEDDVPHTATGTDGAFDVSLSPGASGSHTFDEPGTYPYACSLHPQMTGEIVVS